MLVLTLTNLDQVAFVDEASGALTLANRAHLAAPWQVQASAGTVWYAGHDELGQVDVPTRSITQTVLALNQPDLAIGPAPGGSALHVWLVSALNKGVEDVDPALGRAVSGLSIDTGSNWGASIAFSNGSLWVRLYDLAVTLRITPDPPTRS